MKRAVAALGRKEVEEIIRDEGKIEVSSGHSIPGKGIGRMPYTHAKDLIKQCRNCSNNSFDDLRSQCPF